MGLTAIQFLLTKAKHVLYTPYFLLVLLIVVVSVVRGSSSMDVLSYIILFVGTPFFTYFLIMNNFKRQTIENIYNLLVFIGVIQLPLILFQRLFATAILSVSAKTMIALDIGCGSFFLANDHGLCFYMLSLITFLLFDERNRNRKYKVFLLIWFSVTVVMTSSDVSTGLLCLIWLVYVLVKQIKWSVLYAIMIVVLYIGLATVFPTIQDSLLTSFTKADTYLLSADFNEINTTSAANRFDIIAYYLMENFKWIGNGPFDYWNPRTGFNHFINFSQYIWFYNDLGIIAVLLIPYLFYKIMRTAPCLSLDKYILFGMITVYSLFTNTLSDLAFMFTYSLFILNPVKVIKK
jgi:hypothetical protein